MRQKNAWKIIPWHKTNTVRWHLSSFALRERPPRRETSAVDAKQVPSESQGEDGKDAAECREGGRAQQREQLPFFSPAYKPLSCCDAQRNYSAESRSATYPFPSNNTRRRDTAAITARLEPLPEQHGRTHLQRLMWLQVCSGKQQRPALQGRRKCCRASMTFS